jgi:hypothetical protein
VITGIVASPRYRPLWHPGRLAVPPQIAVDARRADKLTLSGASVTGVRTVHTDIASNSPSGVLYSTANADLNNRPSLNVAGASTQSLNFSTNYASLLNAKGGATMIFCGRFANPSAGAFNSAIVNATTTSASSTRCSIASSGSVGNCPRTTIRRLDGDTANGDDYIGSNIGGVPWIAILRLDHTGAVVGSGTPTKNIRICRSALALLNTSEATGLGSGNFSATNSAYIGFFNSGTVAEALVHMFYGAIMDYVLTDADCERFEGWLADGLGIAGTLLHSSHPYVAGPPLMP